MLSKFGRKVFFVYPPEALKGDFLEAIFKNEYETYLLESTAKIDNILEVFKDSILFFNIDKGLDRSGWIDFIKKLQESYEDIAIGVISLSDSSSLKNTYLMDIGIQGGYIVLEDNTWRSIERINKVLEVNEARGRRKNVRFDFDEKRKDKVFVKVFTSGGYCFNGIAKSFSAMGILVELDQDSAEFSSSDKIDQIVFSVDDHELRVKGSLLKEVRKGEFFLMFEDVSDSDREYVQTYIFNSLQKSFKKLLNSL